MMPIQTSFENSHHPSSSSNNNSKKDNHYHHPSSNDDEAGGDDDDDTNYLWQNSFRGRRSDIPYVAVPYSYHVTDSLETFQVTVTAPRGITAEDIRVQLEDGNRVLSFSTHSTNRGSTNSSRSARRRRRRGVWKESQNINEQNEDDDNNNNSGDDDEEVRMQKRFKVDSNIDTCRITAKLEDGVLVVSAPKDHSLSRIVRKIPITTNNNDESSDENIKPITRNIEASNNNNNNKGNNSKSSEANSSSSSSSNSGHSPNKLKLRMKRRVSP